MKNRCRYLKALAILAALLGFAVTTWSDAGEGQEPAGPSDSWDTYKIEISHSTEMQREKE